jgi:hypothetical protein
MDRVQAEQVALSQIDGGERLLWSGTPAPGVAAVKALPASLFGIPFTGFAVFWIWGAWSATSSGPRPPGPFVLFPLFGVPFVLIGLGVLLSPLWAWLAAHKTVYAVTDKRALIIVGGGARGVRSFTRDDIGDITRFEQSDGSGSVYFATRSSLGSRGRIRHSRVGFEGIPEVRHVERLIREQVAAREAA